MVTRGHCSRATRQAAALLAVALHAGGARARVLDRAAARAAADESASAGSASPATPASQPPIPSTTGSDTAAEPSPASVPGVPERLVPTAKGVKSTFDIAFYGFVELDVIYDDTQSYGDAAGNAAIARPGTLASSNGRATLSVRDSRLGFRLTGPAGNFIATSGVLEMDFLGSQTQGTPAPAGSPAISEAAYFTSPTFRARHYFLKVATPWVDVLAGQTWSLFGWQGFFFPNTVQIPGVPGELSARTPQVRLSRLVRGDVVSLELAAAAARPAQRDSGMPDGQAGLRFMVNQWRGLRTFGATGTATDPLSIGVSATVRRFRIPELSATPTATRSATGWGVSVDSLLPVLPSSGAVGASALTLTASYVRGRGIADQYAGFTGGATFPALATGTYPQDVDNGLLAYSPDGVLHTIGWQSFIVGVQCYMPLSTRAWVSANYSRTTSSDIGRLVTAANAASSAKIFDATDWADVNLFVDLDAAVRLGLEYAWTRQHYLDGIAASNRRVQLAAFYVF